uniref:WD repeat-containing protein 89 n=1 Tax=Trichobilharzia regenti TaxID=157069 RepID=A0AA85J073_TRIRE|nr:unnamed protein product [Trichobilharzia regenti]
MLNIISHLPQKYCENILVAHNNHDMVYQVRGFQLHLIHLSTMQVDGGDDDGNSSSSSRKISVESNLVDIDYSSGRNLLLGCSQKGDVHLWDLRESNLKPVVQSNTNSANNGLSYTCCCISPDGSLICCGTEVCRVKKFDKKKRRKRHDSTDSDEETAHLVYWDTRCLSSPLGSIKDFHSEDIVDVKFDPTSISGYPRLLDCSHDGLVCLYNMQAAAALQDNTLLYMFNSESVASSCGWLLSSGAGAGDSITGVYCTTTMRSNIKAWPIHPSMLKSNSSGRIRDSAEEVEKEQRGGTIDDDDDEEEEEEEIILPEEEQEKLDKKTKLWNSKFINNNSLKGRKFFSVIHQDKKSEEFLLLGEYADNSNSDGDDEDDEIEEGSSPAVFSSHQDDNDKPIWNVTCLPNTLSTNHNNNSQINDTSFNLQYADFLRKPMDSDKQLCLMIGSRSTVLCSYDVLSDRMKSI